jgi:ADP-dependent NAD(P)H-hydrate dehydratase / NAD(P)H-hydrate epimerase
MNPSPSLSGPLHKVVAGATMQKLDARAIEAGIPGLVLMENAARGAVDVLVDALGIPERAWVVCGRGNNGGDGLAMARHLHNRGSAVEVLLLAEPGALQGDAAANLRMARALELPIAVAADAQEASAWLGRRPGPSVLVDAILGTGLQSAPRGLAAAAIEAIEARPELCVFAVDLPSGLSGDAGSVPGAAIRARVTATFGLRKLPHVLYPAAARCGQVHVVEISLPRLFVEEAPAACWTGAPAREWMAPREADSHKGTYGRLLIVAGSPGMTGAAALAARAAVRGGAGLVTVGCVERAQETIAAKTTESLTLALPTDSDGGLALQSIGLILAHLETPGSTLLLGPGLGTVPSTVEAVTRLVEQVETRLILDADGLNCLAISGDTEARLAARPAATILTPHPGEMARLLGRRVEERLADAMSFAAAARSVVLLKGAGTVVTDGVEAYVNATGNPGMATGGSGDVLAGLLGALVAQRLPELRAGVLATYLHGLAGDLAAAAVGQEALAAGDMVEHLPAAWKRWRAGP